jgi:hypothetical protein
VLLVYGKRRKREDWARQADWNPQRPCDAEPRPPEVAVELQGCENREDSGLEEDKLEQAEET